MSIAWPTLSKLVMPHWGPSQYGLVLHLPIDNHVELVLMVIFVIVSISAILYTEYMAMAMKRTRRQVLL